MIYTSNELIVSILEHIEIYNNLYNQLSYLFEHGFISMARNRLYRSLNYGTVITNLFHTRSVTIRNTQISWRVDDEPRSGMEEKECVKSRTKHKQIPKKPTILQSTPIHLKHVKTTFNQALDIIIELSNQRTQILRILKDIESFIEPMQP
jgi:hypothetical protein